MPGSYVTMRVATMDGPSTSIVWTLVNSLEVPIKSQTTKIRKMKSRIPTAIQSYLVTIQLSLASLLQSTGTWVTRSSIRLDASVVKRMQWFKQRRRKPLLVERLRWCRARRIRAISRWSWTVSVQLYWLLSWHGSWPCGLEASTGISLSPHQESKPCFTIRLNC